MEPRFDHSTAVTKNGIYLIGSKTGERGAGRDPSTTYSTEHFPAAPAEGAQGRCLTLAVKTFKHQSEYFRQIVFLNLFAILPICGARG